MALLASSVFTSTLNIKVKQFENQLSPQLHEFLQLNCHHQISSKRRMRVTMAQFGKPDKIKLKEQLSIIRERVWETTPDSVKDFPWKKAENLLLERLLSVGQKALKLSLVTVFVVSCLSELINSISINQELMIPFGLLVGCLVSDFLNETCKQAFTSEGKGLKWLHLLTIGCFFILLKFVSAYFAIQARVFLMHVGNGGLMEVLWRWINWSEENGTEQGNLISMKDESSAANEGSQVDLAL